MNLSEKIQIIRKARRITQEELGDKIGVSRQAVSDWEKGKYDPTLDSIRAIAQVLNVSFDALLDENVDLNDAGTLDAILKNNNHNSKKYQEKFEVEFCFLDRPKENKRKLIILSIILPLLLLIGIASIVIATIFDEFFIYGIVIGVMCIMASPILIARLISFIQKYRGKLNEKIAGSITQDTLVVNIRDNLKKIYVASYIPISEIEHISYKEGQNEWSGFLIIKIRNKSKPIITEEIVNPQRVIEIVNSSHEPIAN